MDSFQIMWMKLPILAAVFVSSPWILYQVWAFIAPGSTKRKRICAPFVFFSAGCLFWEASSPISSPSATDLSSCSTRHRQGHRSLRQRCGILRHLRRRHAGRRGHLRDPRPAVLLTLIRVASPVFLVNHSRYAILIIVNLAAIITPTGDVFNLALFATPMIILFYIGIFASYILVLKRENRRFPCHLPPADAHSPVRTDSYCMASS